MATKTKSPKKKSNPVNNGTPTIRNRIIERKRIRGTELAANARNFRTHPKAKADALRGVLNEIGQVGELYAYHSERNGGKLTLLDGHLRTKEFGGLDWDVAITDLTDAEADKFILTYDPLAAMATADKDRLDALLRDVQMGDEAIAALLAGLAEENGIVPGKEPAADVGLKESWEVIVECSGETEQKEVYDQLSAEGRTCRVATL